MNELINFPTSLNNLKTKIDNLDVGKLKAVPVDLKKLSDIVSKEVVKNTKFNTINTKVDNLDSLGSPLLLTQNYQKLRIKFLLLLI